MKVIAEVILHYGKEWLDYALQSINPYVDKIVVLYCDTASQGHPTDAKCPDTREELFAIASKYEKVQWVDLHDLGNEGEHRKKIFNYTDGYDVVLLCDADEVYEPMDLPKSLYEAYNSPVRYHLVSGFKHFWKGKKYYCDDHFQPMRFINLHKETGEATINCRVYHFSYASRMEVIEYKLKVSGHYDEFRKDWLDIYKAWTPESGIKHLHPTSLQIWEEAKLFNEELPYGL